MQNNPEIEKICSEIMLERNYFIEDFMKKNPGLRLSFSDMEQGFILRKIAEFEFRLQQLEKANAAAQSYFNLHTPLI
jgi:hypothetical protein